MFSKNDCFCFFFNPIKLAKHCDSVGLSEQLEKIMLGDFT